MTPIKKISSRNIADEYVKFVAQQTALSAIYMQEIERESDKDVTLKIRDAIISQDWSQCSTGVKSVRYELTRI